MTKQRCLSDEPTNERRERERKKHDYFGKPLTPEEKVKLAAKFGFKLD